MINYHKHLSRIFLMQAVIFFAVSPLFAAPEASPAPAPTIGSTQTATIAKNLEPFLDQYCVDCHDSDIQKGDLNLFDLAFDPSDDANLDMWITVFDRAQSGEMPPKKKKRPNEKDLAGFLRTLSVPLNDTLNADHDAFGRVRSRRLNRIEYENTMHDILGIDIPLQDFLPADTYFDGFATVAAAQQVSHFLLEKYLDAADASLDEAFNRVLNPAKPFAHIYTSAELGRSSGQRDPWHVGDETIAWSSTQVYHGRIPETEIKKTGWYRITLHNARAVNPVPGKGVWCTVRSGIGYAKAPIMYPIGILRADNTKRDHSFEAWIVKEHLIEARPYDRTIPVVYGTGLNNYRGSTRDKRPMPKQPGLAYSAITIESIHRTPPVDQIQTMLFGDLAIDAENHNVISKSPRKDAARLMSVFAKRAFRRPVVKKEIAPYLGLVNDDLANGVSFTDALKGGYRALLCSPRFLYFNEMPGPLDNHEIATRLSYFLWSTTPDAALLKAAGKGQLVDAKIRRQQVERMLNAPQASGLVTALADQWLNLREIDNTAPDTRLYRQFDESLKQSMIAETHAFLGKLINEDLSTSNFIHSNFAMLNERLATHYKIPGVHHEEIRPVKVSPESHRGGVITQGAVLKVTANGTTTSPVVRGAWINERILGVEIPTPPDNVPAIEPDIRGAKTIREQLAKHSSDPACANCHYKIDPPGFALENYDVIGGWRTTYPTVSSKDPKLPVEPDYDMPDGSHFEDIEQFKQLILKDPQQIARNFAHKLITYSTGASVSFGDRAAIEKILEQTQSSDYGVRSIIHAVIDSPIFLSK